MSEKGIPESTQRKRLRNPHSVASGNTESPPPMLLVRAQDKPGPGQGMPLESPPRSCRTFGMPSPSLRVKKKKRLKHCSHYILIALSHDACSCIPWRLAWLTPLGAQPIWCSAWSPAWFPEQPPSSPTLKASPAPCPCRLVLEKMVFQISQSQAFGAVAVKIITLIELKTNSQPSQIVSTLHNTLSSIGATKQPHCSCTN